MVSWIGWRSRAYSPVVFESGLDCLADNSGPTHWLEYMQQIDCTVAQTLVGFEI
jgi:hypothetical protein